MTGTPVPGNAGDPVTTPGGKDKDMLYRITYKRRSDRDRNKWTEFREVLQLKELYSCMKWLEECSDTHSLISVEPF